VAREALRDKLRHNEENGSAPVGLTMTVVQQIVAAEWGVTPEGLKSKTRTKTLTTPRQVAMYLARELLSMQLVEIGQAFGGRDHSTVIHSLERVSSGVNEDPEFAERVGKVRAMLESARG
jgi:chromosomal replication initiator protein